MSENVQIPNMLFLHLLDYFCDEQDEHARELTEAQIRLLLEDKLDKLISRQLYSQYKRAATDSERETARKAYLDHRNMPRSYRTEKEIREQPPS